MFPYFDIEEIRKKQKMNFVPPPSPIVPVISVSSQQQYKSSEIYLVHKRIYELLVGKEMEIIPSLLGEFEQVHENIVNEVHWPKEIAPEPSAFEYKVLGEEYKDMSYADADSLVQRALEYERGYVTLF